VHKRQGGNQEHEHYEQLCALAVGGLMESAEIVDFQTHLRGCSECRSDYEELSSVLAFVLPQAQKTFQQNLAESRTKPLPDSRQRFLRRARTEGVVFSREIEVPVRSSPWYFRPVAMSAAVAGLVLIAVSLPIYHLREAPRAAGATDAAAAQQIAELKRENSALAANLSRLSDSVAAGERQIQNLRSQLGVASLRRNREQPGRDAEQSDSQTAHLLEESRNQEKLLTEARDEAARSSQLRVNDEASVVEQQARITDLTNKLRIASATLDQERQLVAAGSDIRELMAARQLHVIDVRDTDPNGNHSEAFGRVFLTEGKSLTFYAFDLNEGRAESATRRFQVWAGLEAGTKSAHSLGFLRVDAKAQGRWVLKVENPELVKAIDSVFVTVEPAAGGQRPSGQKMLYAYLGDANHP
jgi:predicted  nucleic acid-binding Zn-ribbon protein